MCHGDQTHGLRHNGMMLTHQFGRELVNTVLPDKRGMEIKATYVAQEFLLAIGFLDLRGHGHWFLRIKAHLAQAMVLFAAGPAWARFSFLA